MRLWTLAVSIPLWLACGAPRPTYVEAPAAAELTVTPGVGTLTWRKGLNAAQTLVVRTVGSVDATKPPEAVAVGDTFGGGTVLALSDGERFIDANLPDSCGPFAWHLWSRASDGTWSAEAATVRSLRGAHTIPPTAQVTDLVATLETSTVRLTWTAPDAMTGFVQVSVLRKHGSAPASPTDGVVVYSGPSTVASDPLANLSTTGPTWYAVFNCNACGACALGPPVVSVTRP